LLTELESSRLPNYCMYLFEQPTFGLTGRLLDLFFLPDASNHCAKR